MSFWEHNSTLSRQLEAVDQRLTESVRSRESLVENAATELIHGPGKRLRPALTLMAASFGTSEDSIVDVAAAIELLHMATLVHDDIIDEVKLRRGVETTQSKFGKDVAVYTGDFLFVKSFQLIAKADAAERMPDLARVMQVICEGEINQYSDRYNAQPSVLNYLRKIRGKTAMLFALSSAVGAKQAQCDDKNIRLLAKYGLYLGMAFQIQDDILDLTSTDENMGKPVGNDIKEGIYTLPIIYGLMNDEVNRELQRLLGLSPSRAVIGEIIQLVVAGGGLARARRVMRKYLSKAETVLSQLPENPNKATLQRLLEVPFQSTNPLKHFTTSPELDPALRSIPIRAASDAAI